MRLAVMALGAVFTLIRVKTGVGLTEVTVSLNLIRYSTLLPFKRKRSSNLPKTATCQDKGLLGKGGSSPVDDRFEFEQFLNQFQDALNCLLQKKRQERKIPDIFIKLCRVTGS